MLRPEGLTISDIDSLDDLNPKSVLRSATRYEEQLGDVPFTSFVITGEEILRNGYVTLADVLHSIPGIRVSQPGNTMEGETFMVRGLSGNQQMKILINDVPVKPLGATGMPVGAQLPIRQAERIEVVFGPASAIYGIDATAGVVNIILKESRRPIFTQAELSFGNLGYNNLDLLCGGRLGRDDKIFRFSIYGSSTVRDQTDILWDSRVFNADNYVPAGLDSTLYLGRRNFIPQFGTSTSQAQTTGISHESRLFGIRLSWRGLHLTVHRMVRNESQALGLNPLAQSWADAGDRFSERLQTATLGLERQARYSKSSLSLSVISYRVQEGTVHTVFNQLQSAIYAIQSPALTDAEQELLLDSLYGRYAGLERYTTALTLETRGEARTRLELGSRLFLDIGAIASLGSGVPVVGYFRSPPVINFGEGAQATGSPFTYTNSGDLDLTGMVQFDWKSNRLRIIAGAAGFVALGFNPAFTPRIAAQYRFYNQWTAYGNYSTGIYRPSMYARVNQFVISENTVALQDNIESDLPLSSTEAFEIGIRKATDSSYFHLSFFHQNTYNLARPGLITPVEAPGAPQFRLGYAVPAYHAMRAWGINAYWNVQLFNISFGMDGRNYPLTGNLKFGGQYTRGQEKFGDVAPAISEIRNQPRWHTYFELSFRVNKLAIMLSSNRNTSSLSTSVAYPDAFGRTPFGERLPTYRTWEWMTRYYLSKQFVVYFHIQNLFNRRYAGLDATGTTDDLLFNPQQGRLFRFGVSYNMN